MATSGSYDWKLNRNQVITAALRKLAVLPSGGTATTAQINDGVQALNSILKAFHADGMPLWGIDDFTFTTTADKYEYSIGIGVGNDLNNIAPLRVIQARAQEATASSGILMNLSNRYDFNLLPLNTDSTSFPTTLYYQPLLDNLGVIKIWPIPDTSTVNIKIDYQRPFQDMDASTDDLDFPNYWTQAVIYTLAWSLAPEYGIAILDRQQLGKESEYWRGMAEGYSAEEGSVFLQPNPTFRND